MLIFLALSALADHNENLYVSAQNMEYMQDDNLVTASGDALLWDESNLLRADLVSYQHKDKIYGAQGGVWLKRPSGEVFFADQANIKQDFTQGELQCPKVLLENEYRIAAIGACRSGNKTKFKKTVYSPCNIRNGKCLWQLKAKKVTHDQDKQDITYRDAQLEFLDVPIFYTPYFSHPDPKVKRRNGILMPIYGSSSDLGLIFGLPYFYIVDKSQDITVTPFITSKQGAVLNAEHRKRFKSGFIQTQGSITKSKTPNNTRWHLFSNGRFELNDSWLAQFQLNRASDLTYMRRYGIVTRGTPFATYKNLHSKVVFERFFNRDYLLLDGHWFQTDNKKQTPVVAPRFWFSKQISGSHGAKYNFDIQWLSLLRQVNQENRYAQGNQRLSVGASGFHPYIAGNHILEANWIIREDLYQLHEFNVKNYDRPYQRDNLNASARLFANGSLKWRYPWIKRFNCGSWTMEPMVMLSSSFVGDNGISKPNEDSRNIELDDTRLFLPNRFQGSDKVDIGQRIVYGVNNYWLWKNHSVNWFVGQSRRLDDRNVLGDSTGERKGFSDYVSKLFWSPNNWFHGHWRGIFQGNGKARLSEAGAMLGKPVFNVNAYHTTFLRTSGRTGQVNFTVNSNFTKNWHLSVAHSRNTTGINKGGLAYSGFVFYQNECFKGGIGAYRTHYRDRDIKPDSGALFYIAFKSLGSVKSSNAPPIPGFAW